MATGFSTRSGPDGYRLNFDTDNLDYYLLMQKIARHCVDGKPAADVAPVRHGCWIDLNAENSTGPLFKCSECSHLHNPNRNDLDLERVELKPLYCDACGARMDKEDDHEAG